MTNREQTRRDAVEDIRKALRHLVAQDRFEAPLAVDAGLAIDALLAELEQAERERDEWERKYNALLDNGGVIPG